MRMNFLEFSNERKRLYDESLFLNPNNAGNAGYFSKKVKRREHWRLYDVFKKRCLSRYRNRRFAANSGELCNSGRFLQRV
jgi:hypothetical protein